MRKELSENAECADDLVEHCFHYYLSLIINILISNTTYF